MYDGLLLATWLCFVELGSYHFFDALQSIKLLEDFSHLNATFIFSNLSFRLVCHLVTLYLIFLTLSFASVPEQWHYHLWRLLIVSYVATETFS